MTPTASTPVTRRADYKPYSHLVDAIDLTFELGKDENQKTIVTSKMTLRHNPEAPRVDTLALDGGKDVELRGVKVNDRILTGADYNVENGRLVIPHLPEQATVEIVTAIDPHKNTEYQGLYVSDGNFVSQCETQGFRNITYFSDRPDVMTRYTTKIVADRVRYPELLSNGNKLGEGKADGTRDYVTWADPKPKASYLFALVAGAFDVVEGKHTAPSGHVTQLHFYSPKGQGEDARFAMNVLDKAMAWDEKFSGHECTLDDYKVVAASKFNAGAMENRGLNIFASRGVLANPQTAQDVNFKNIAATIAHEYCHDLTGNDVTQKMWTDIALKEGFTKYREQECVNALNPTPVNRIDAVETLRAFQFPLDAKPQAHPVLRQEYTKPDNCYDATTYNKGAELIRMIAAIIGPEAFHKGMNLYRTEYDGKAIWTEDLIKVFEKASGKDLSQFFETWYKQPGTPEVKAAGVYDEKAHTYTLTLKQDCESAPGQPLKKPFHIPIRMGLVDADGKDMPLHLQDGEASGDDVLQLRDRKQTFVFTGVRSKPIPSLLRDFSAPVKLDFPYSNAELTFLMQHDQDGFNRYEAGQRIAVSTFMDMLEAQKNPRHTADAGALTGALRSLLHDQSMDKELKARMLTLPGEKYLAELVKKPVDPIAIHRTRQQLQRIIGTQLKSDLERVYGENISDAPYQFTQPEIGRRSLLRTAMNYLAAMDPQKYVPEALARMGESNNLTDKAGNYQTVLEYCDALPEKRAARVRKEAVEGFRKHAEIYPPAVVPWLIGQSLGKDATESVKTAIKSDLFDGTVPSHVRASLGFFSDNKEAFHNQDGSGYRFLANQVIHFDTDEKLKNPQLAASLLEPLTRFSSLAEPYRSNMRRQLERISGQAQSDNVRELVAKALAPSQVKRLEGSGAQADTPGRA